MIETQILIYLSVVDGNVLERSLNTLIEIEAFNAVPTLVGKKYVQHYYKHAIG